MKTPFFSVLIPTRERADNLRQSLILLVNQEYENCEFIVCDNASCDDTEAVVGSINDARLKYVKSEQRISMSENWDFALRHATGDWVTIIGDDDGILPSGLGFVANLIESYGTEAIRTATCSYWWSSLTGRNPVLSVPRGANRVEVRNSIEHVENCLNGITAYSQLPMLYNGGYIKRSLIERIRGQSQGRFYNSDTPDVYSAFAIALSTEYYLYCDTPTAINGASKYSAGVSGFSLAKDENKKREANLFFSEATFRFDPALIVTNEARPPRATALIIYEGYFSALRTLRDRHDISVSIAKLPLVARAITPKPYIAEVNEWLVDYVSAHRLRSPSQLKVFAYILYLFYRQLDNLSYKVLRRLRRKTFCHHVDNIAAAGEKANSILF